MAAIDQVVSVNITNQTAAVPVVSFATPLIVGPSAPGWTDAVRVYSTPSALLTDGYTITSPEYVYALELYAQAITPAQFLVGRRILATPSQTDTFSVGTVLAAAYTLTVNGTSVAYTATGTDTQQSILTALGANIAAATQATVSVAGTGSSALLTVVAPVGVTLTYTTIDSKLTRTVVQAGPGAFNPIATDLTSISAQNNTWYGMVIAGASDADILAAAAYIEANQKLYLALSVTSAIGTTATTDVLSTLKGRAYKRTALLFSPANAASGAEAAWMGGQLPATPGSNDWAYKTLVGITPDSLTATQVSTVVGSPIAGTAGKNGNIYTSVGGIPVTQQGITVSGQYIDITIGLDWLQKTMQANIYAAIVNATKIPYTDAGVAILISAVRATIDQGVSNGLIDGATAIVITAPGVLTVPTNQRANRIAPTITFTCRLAGAVQSVLVSGTVTV